MTFTRAYILRVLTVPWGVALKEGLYLIVNKTEFQDIRKHLILYHSFDELKQWGINREYLKYQERIVSLDSFIGQIDKFKNIIMLKDQRIMLKLQATLNQSQNRNKVEIVKQEPNVTEGLKLEPVENQ